jgi:hypothetical protein
MQELRSRCNTEKIKMYYAYRGKSLKYWNGRNLDRNSKPAERPRAPGTLRDKMTRRTYMSTIISWSYNLARQTT